MYFIIIISFIATSGVYTVYISLFFVFVYYIYFNSIAFYADGSVYESNANEAVSNINSLVFFSFSLYFYFGFL